MPGSVNLSFMDVVYFCIPMDLLEFCSWDKVKIIGQNLTTSHLTVSGIVRRIMVSLQLIIPSCKALWVLHPMPWGPWACPVWPLGTGVISSLAWMQTPVASHPPRDSSLCFKPFLHKPALLCTQLRPAGRASSCHSPALPFAFSLSLCYRLWPPGCPLMVDCILLN